jgi:hypothetical protein
MQLWLHLPVLRRLMGTHFVCFVKGRSAMRSWTIAQATLATAVCIAAPASAMDSCSGIYSATLLHPLTEPTIVALDQADSSDVSKHLGEAFTNGMQEAGTTVTGTPTVKLRLSYQIIGQGGSGTGGGGGLNQGGGAQTGWSSWSGGDAAALQGGQTAALPDIPNFDVFSPKQPVQSALLVVRFEARNVGAEAPDWVASLQCTMQGTDNKTLAYQLGRLIGGAIGKQRSNAPV